MPVSRFRKRCIRDRLTINWNPDPELFNFFGISIRYYGLLWIIGLAFAYLIVQHQYQMCIRDSIGVAFDPSGPTVRHEAYEQYKAQREETPEAIRLSVPIIKDIIRAYRIPILEVSLSLIHISLNEWSLSMTLL